MKTWVRNIPEYLDKCRPKNESKSKKCSPNNIKITKDMTRKIKKVMNIIHFSLVINIFI